MLQLNCNNCGASLEVDLTKPKIICKYCRAEYLANELLTENRINDMDMYNRLEPVARNAYNLYNYNEALSRYLELLLYGQTEADIARYNICMLGLEQIKPTEEFFKSLKCLDYEEIFSHLEHIRIVAKNIVKSRIKDVIKNYSGIDKIKAVFSILRWYKPYKYMIEVVEPVECFCGRQIGMNESKCSCGATRKDIIKQRRDKKKTFKFCIILLGCVFVTFAIRLIFFHNL